MELMIFIPKSMTEEEFEEWLIERCVSFLTLRESVKIKIASCPVVDWVMRNELSFAE